LMRLPYGTETVPVRTFRFEENVRGPDRENYLWGNAAYFMGTRLTDAFARYGWCASIGGVEGGGLVRDLPSHSFVTESGEMARLGPTDVIIADRWETELSNLGFITLVHYRGTNFAVFFSVQSCQKPWDYDDDNATANARAATRLPYILVVSRFAHYIMAIARDIPVSLTTRSGLERSLNDWIHNYVCEESESDDEQRRRPLREARVDVEEYPNRPGCYRAVAQLSPHYQLGDNVRLRLYIDLPRSPAE
jgi:type VI secretion system protein ImpC